MRSVRPDNVESKVLKFRKVGEKLQTPVLLLAKEGGTVRLAMETGKLRSKRTYKSDTQSHHDAEGLSYRSINDIKSQQCRLRDMAARADGFANQASNGTGDLGAGKICPPKLTAALLKCADI